MEKTKPDSETVATLRDKLRQAAKDSGMTQEELGFAWVSQRTSPDKPYLVFLNVEIDYDRAFQPSFSSPKQLANL